MSWGFSGIYRCDECGWRAICLRGKFMTRRRHRLRRVCALRPFAAGETVGACPVVLIEMPYADLPLETAVTLVGESKSLHRRARTIKYTSDGHYAR